MVTVVDAFAAGRVNELSWTTDGHIVYGSFNGPLFRVSVDGDDLERVTEPTPGSNHRFPSVDSTGSRILFSVRSPDPAEEGLYLLALETGQQYRLGAGAMGHFVDGGHVVFLHDDTLWRAELATDGDGFVAPPVPIRGNVVQNPDGGGHLAAALDGTIALASHRGRTNQLVWVSRDCSEEAIAEAPGPRSGARDVTPFGLPTTPRSCSPRGARRNQ